MQISIPFILALVAFVEGLPKAALPLPEVRAEARNPVSIHLHSKRQEQYGFQCQNMTISIPLVQNVVRFGPL